MGFKCGLVGMPNVGKSSIFNLLTSQKIDAKNFPFCTIDPKDIIVAYDDLDLSPGKVRLKFSGGSGGHNGIKDIIEKIGTKDFWRLKIGIGKPIHKDDVISYVLGKPSPEDKDLINSGIDKILINSKDIISGNYTNFMNNINGGGNGI